jgi:hypothetical protein
MRKIILDIEEIKDGRGQCLVGDGERQFDAVERLRLREGAHGSLHWTWG